MNLLISNGVNSAPASINDVPVGQIAIFNVETGAVAQEDITAAAQANKLYQIVQGTVSGKPQIISKIFKGKDVVKNVLKDYAAPTFQSTFVGFNGVNTGLSIPEVSNGVYALKLVDLTQGWEPFPRTNYEVKAAATASQVVIANGLAEAINNADDTFINSDLINKHFVRAELYVNEVATNLVDSVGDTDVTVAVTQDSNVVVATVGSGETVKDLVAGDYLRIGGTTIASPVYKVASIEDRTATTKSIILTMPFAGATATGVDAGRIAAAAPAASDVAGVRLIAKLAKTTFRTFTIEDLAGADITPENAPFKGSGSNEQVKELELASFSVRSYYETNYFPQTPESTVAAGKNYDLITLEIANDNDRSVLRENETSRLIIALQEDGANVATIKGYFGV